MTIPLCCIVKPYYDTFSRAGLTNAYCCKCEEPICHTCAYKNRVYREGSREAIGWFHDHCKP